jgi:DNA-binding MarR family transcriptional regulator
MLTRFFFATARTRMSRTEAGLLNMLYERPCRITELAAREGITQPAVTQLVNRLEARGWVVRTTDPDDRRAVLVELTDVGVEEFEHLRADYRALMRSYMADLDYEELETLSDALEILDRVVERFDAG